jgi:DNA-binding HxlR family transcriptional regulator
VAAGRSYAEVCPIARALDRVGDRWLLLVVRELTLGPRRFSDLRRALPGLSSNMLADRLRKLEADAVVRRRTLPPPAASRVYELTQRGSDLEPVLDALAAWGSRAPCPPDGSFSSTSVLYLLRSRLRSRPGALDASYRIHLDDGVWTIREEGGRVGIRCEDMAQPNANIQTDSFTLSALLLDPSGLDRAAEDGSLRVEGDVDAVRRLLRAASTTTAGG